MKTKFTCLFFLFALSRGFAAIPDKIDGYVYYEADSNIGAGDARSYSTSALLLKNDGTFTGLFEWGSPFFGTPASLKTLADGTYSYRKIDGQTAELSLSFPLGDSQKRTLQFASDLSGTMAGGGPLSTFGIASFNFVSPTANAPLVNCSNRSFVRAGGTAFAGFVVANSGSRVLVRAVGPTLALFGVTDALRNPTLKVVSAATNTTVGNNDDWSSDSAPAIAKTSALVGAFPLGENSKDSAVILSLAPGAYIAQVSSPDAADTGEALIEIYLLP